MKPVFQIMPIALLFGGAIVAVWRGMGTKPTGQGKYAAEPKERRKTYTTSSE